MNPKFRCLGKYEHEEIERLHNREATVAVIAQQVNGSAAESAGTAGNGEKRERNRSHYRIPSSVHHNTDSEIPYRRDRGKSEGTIGT